MSEVQIDWHGVTKVGKKGFLCGYCGLNVGPDEGYLSTSSALRIFICPHCCQPTFFNGDRQVPGVRFGSEVEHLPEDVGAVYEEARNCMSISAFAAAAMLCRKILMNVAVSKGAKEGESFAYYVDFLAEKNFIPPDGKDWVGHVREKGNDANHQIRLTSEADAKNLLTFVEMLLRFVFDFPARIDRPAAETS